MNAVWEGKKHSNMPFCFVFSGNRLFEIFKTLSFILRHQKHRWEICS